GEPIEPRAAPARLRDVERRRDDDPALRDAEPEEEVHEERLPGAEHGPERERGREAGDADEREHAAHDLDPPRRRHRVPPRAWRARTQRTSSQRSATDVASPYAGMTTLPLRIVA